MLKRVKEVFKESVNSIELPSISSIVWAVTPTIIKTILIAGFVSALALLGLILYVLVSSLLN